MLILTLILLHLSFICSATIILPPVNFDGQQTLAIIFQEKLIDSQKYIPFAKALQEKLDQTRLWVAIAQFPQNTPQSEDSLKTLNQALADLKNAGFSDLSEETICFFIGHGLGGNVLQDLIFKNQKALPIRVSGLILEASFIKRSYYSNMGVNTLPILTIGAELDGLVRISRFSESYFFDSKLAQTLVINGMNHYQFTGDESDPPEFISQNDFKPEITTTNATDQSASIITAFIKQQLGLEIDESIFKKYASSTNRLLQPLIDAFKLEGSYNFNLPCYQSSSPNCTYGCPWTSRSMQIMATSNVTIQSHDRFYPAAKIFPDPLPEIFNTCTKQNDCMLNISTVSELIYASKQIDDDAFQPQAATEIRSKLKSRQAVLQAATGKMQDFDKTDSGSLCGEINSAALGWAIEKTPAEVLMRYHKIGKELVIGDDLDYTNDGPLWIWAPISYQDKIDPRISIKPFTLVSAPLQKFKADYWITLSAGIHFCKVLSPARALEWIYFDSLKPFVR